MINKTCSAIGKVVSLGRKIKILIKFDRTRSSEDK